jgi:hypothetical protein
MATKKSWDDIPSLGLSLDDGSSQPAEHRAAVRLPTRDLQDLLMMPRGRLPVRVRYKDRIRTGALVDISQKGMGIQLQDGHGLIRDMIITLSSRLGERSLSVRAVARWTTPDKIGVEFVNPKKDDYEFLSELYAAKVLGGGF